MIESRLTFIRDTEKRNGYNKLALYLCTCGEFKEAYKASVKSGHTKSCGCLKREVSKAKATTHGFTGESWYVSYRSMMQRCYNKKNDRYGSYGGRGLVVCEEWKNSPSSFLRDMGERPSKAYSVDRIDNTKGYSKENCRWATRKQQQNNRRGNSILSAYGSVMTIAQWSEALEVPAPRISSRKCKGWSDHSALFTPKCGTRVEK